MFQKMKAVVVVITFLCVCVIVYKNNEKAYLIGIKCIVSYDRKCLRPFRMIDLDNPSTRVNPSCGVVDLSSI